MSGALPRLLLCASASGSGKTTAVRTVLGLLPPGGTVEGGRVTFEGHSLLGLSHKEWGRLRGKELSMIFQDSGAMLNPIRTVGSQFREYIRAHSVLSRQEAAELSGEMLARMGLPNPESILASYPFQLSGGQRQRVGIAMAMTFQPRLLLADDVITTGATMAEAAKTAAFLLPASITCIAVAQTEREKSRKRLKSTDKCGII